MKTGVSILFNAYFHFRNNLSATFGCPTGYGLPQPQFQTNFSNRKAQPVTVQWVNTLLVFTRFR
ncbi:MAG: hypothetical protein WA151_13870 [Desulfatirhabdiaceae bacterium]